ncbi:DUF1761 domain-containing protein [Novosphingobium sp. FSY-8]|uniref:DUF1761 domain-containing protein n=1 Tax=Novosphingobium ovatum TaxID=1908523 RepID=A0ABW9X944_9SPHN|nr:DUF1761 domain-containing protein [Novosphingobium ovatum]NBC35054.1 DUF1761 domain-containing protein [Novosphingobium ovatum]
MRSARSGAVQEARMGAVNWLAVGVAALLAAGLAWPWYGLWRSTRGPAGWRMALMILPAAMIGHNFARVGLQHLAEKPKLYAMMSGGWALAIVLPVLAMAYGRHPMPPREAWADATYILAAFLLMGAVFMVMGPVAG